MESRRNKKSGQTNNKEIDAIIKNFSTNKSPGADGFTGKFYPTLKELFPVPPKFFQKEKREHFQTHNATIIQNTKARPRHNKRKLQASVLMNIDAKILSTVLVN
jgi:hypothetical protein